MGGKGSAFVCRTLVSNATKLTFRHNGDHVEEAQSGQFHGPLEAGTEDVKGRRRVEHGLGALIAQISSGNLE